jgi:beta-N-acetylhexosaminidase
MSSHPLYRRLDPANIATFSRRIITDCLRDELHFQGVISSDDLEMGAIKESVGIGVAAVKTAAAGHDLILSCHDFKAQRDVAQALNEAYRSKFLPVSELEESVERVEALRRKRPRRFEGAIGPKPQGGLLALDVARRAVEVVQDPKRMLPLTQALAGRAAVIFPRLSDLSKRIMIESVFDDEKKFIADHWGTPAPGLALYGLDATDDDILSAASAAGKAEVTVFFCYDAHLHPRQQLLLASLRQASRRLVLGSMRDPYDREFLEKNDVGLAIFGWRACQVQAAINKIRGTDV